MIAAFMWMYEVLWGLNRGAENQKKPFSTTQMRWHILVYPARASPEQGQFGFAE